MKMDQEKRKKVMEELLSNVEKYAELDPSYSLVKRLNDVFPMDIGIISPLILNRIVLNEGEAIYLPAGELHSYIEGVGVELMANSDNVLRGGLTHKHVDVEELLNILNFDWKPMQVIVPRNIGQSEAIYPVPVEEFLLSIINVDDNTMYLSRKDRPVEIMIIMDGEIDMETCHNGKGLNLKKGESVLIPSAMPQYMISGNATIYKASVPI